MKKLLTVAACLAAFFVGGQHLASAEPYVPSEGNMQAREKFQDSKFGIFIHWGLYSMLGTGEWTMTNANINYKEYAKLADAFTPLAKGMNSEYANQNAYDCIQVHGGSGFMLEYACQRIYRDARITSIYEGTTQLQVVAAIRYVTNGAYAAVLHDFEQLPVSAGLQPLMEQVKNMTAKFEECTNLVKEAQNQELHDFMARRLYEMAAVCIMSHLLLQDATRAPEMFVQSAKNYVGYGMAEVEKHCAFIKNFQLENLSGYRK